MAQARTRNLLAGSGASLDPAKHKAEQFAHGLDHARARSQEAYVEIGGYGMTMDPTLDDHYGGMADAIRMALKNLAKS